MKRPLKNIFLLGIGDVGTRALGFLATIYLARVLGTSGFGSIQIGLSVLGYLLLVASPGIGMLETRNVSATEGSDVARVRNVLTLRFVLAIVLVLCAVAGALLFVTDVMVRASIMSFSLSLLPLALFLDWYMSGKEEFGLLTIARVLNACAYLLLVVMLVESADGVLLVGISFLIANAISVATLLFAYSRQQEGFTFQWNPSVINDIVRGNVPVGLTMILAQSVTHLPPIVIGMLLSTADAGVFSAAVKIVFVLLMLDRILNSMLLPAATRYITSRPDEAATLLSIAFKWVIVVMAPVTLLGVILSPMAIELVYEAAYIQATPVLMIMMLYFFLTLVNTVCVCGLVASGNEKTYSHTMNMGSVFTIVALVLGTAIGGIVGSAVAIVVGELITVLLMSWRLQSILRLPIFAGNLRSMVSVGVMAGVAMVLQESSVHIQGMIALAVYAFALIILRVVPASEIAFMRERVV